MAIMLSRTSELCGPCYGGAIMARISIMKNMKISDSTID
jgi:hypothetical protein